MPGAVKNIALIGANKEGLKLLPVLLADSKTKVRLIADPNREAMLFKLNELGYRLSESLGIRTTSDLEELKKVEDLDVVINALQDQATEKFLESPEFRDVEKLRPLSTRLIWGVKASAPTGARAADKANEQATLLASLREIVDAVRLTIDRRELLSVILKLATESTGAERGSIMLLSEEKALRVEIAKGMDEEVVRKIRVPVGEGVSGKVARDGKPILLSGKARTEEFSRPMDRSDVKSAMCVPLVVNGEIIGVINVNSSESTHTFTNEDLSFLTSLAALAAEVIQRSNEYEKLRVDAAKFTFWKEVDSIMTSNLPLDKRLNAVTRRLSEIVPGLTSFIFVFDEDSNRLYLKASSIRDSKGLGLMSLRPGEGIEGAGFESGRDVVLVDRTEDRNLKRVYISLPMVSRGKPLGTFNAHIISAQGLSVYHESFLKDIRTLIAESLYKFRQEDKERLKSRKMFAVDEAGLEMISIRDPKRLVTIIATTPAAILGAEGSLLRIRQAGLKRYQTASTFGLDDKNVREYFLPIEKETVMEVLRKKETVMREFSEEASPYIRSVLARPLFLDDEVVGILTFFNKTLEGSVYPCAFSKMDSEILARFSVYAEKALANVLGGGVKVVKPGNAGTHSPMADFEKKVEEELNRARRYDNNLVLSTVRIAGLKDLPASVRTRFEDRLIGMVRKKTRNFDYVIKLNDETYGFLFVNTSEKITRLPGTVAEAVTADEALGKAVTDKKIDVLYGFANFPQDGDSFVELVSKASDRARLDPGAGADTSF